MNQPRYYIINYKRLIYCSIFVVMYGITEFGRFRYRPYIYENLIEDFGIADSIGNIGGIIVQIFFGLTVLNPTHKNAKEIILIFVIGYIIYEILQNLFPGGVLDLKDIIGTLIGGVIGFTMYSFVNRINKLNKVIYSLR